MKKIKILAINLIFLAVSAIAIRTVRMYFQVYMSNAIGASGVGLYQLVMSVNFFALTFASSGVRLASARLSAEAASTGGSVMKAVRVCLGYCLFFSIAAAILTFAAAPFIGRVWLGDPRAVLAVRVAAAGLPFLALSSVYSGYFTATDRAVIYASTQLLEQFVKVLATVFLLEKCRPYGVEYVTAAAVGGYCVGETLSFFILSAIYLIDRRRHKKRTERTRGVLVRLFKIALPVAVSGYVGSAMRTLQQLLVPFGFRRSGASSESALADYGMINGMVMPVIMLPSVIIETAADLILPEIAGSAAAGGKRRPSYIINRALKLGIIFSLFTAGVLALFARDISGAVYGSVETAWFICLFAVLVPFVYLDIIADSALKGMGEQIHSMMAEIAESAVSVVLIYFLLPRFALGGYIFVIFFGSVFSFCLNITQLKRSFDVKISIAEIAGISLCAACSLVLARLLSGVLNAVIAVALGAAAYVLLMRLFACVTAEDVEWLKSIVKN